MTKVEGLSISIKKKNRTYSLVRDVCFKIEQGQILGIVGESGSGKSLITSAILGMLNHLEGLEGSVGCPAEYSEGFAAGAAGLRRA